jgi:hypothetical protein
MAFSIGDWKCIAEAEQNEAAANSASNRPVSFGAGWGEVMRARRQQALPFAKGLYEAAHCCISPGRPRRAPPFLPCEPLSATDRTGPDGWTLDLRAWTDHPGDWMEIRSDIAVSAGDALKSGQKRPAVRPVCCTAGVVS